MLALLHRWWPVFALLYVPSLVAAIMRIVLTRAFRRLDEAHDDDLPQTAGDWLDGEIARLGLTGQVRSVVTDAAAKLSLDAYHPFQGVIQLGAETHFKRDPMQWAIAAHELGHARFHIGRPVLGRVMIYALFLKRTLIATASALVIGNLAFARPHITDLAFAMFVVSAALHLFVLIDELVASLYAMQSLRASPVYGWSHLRSARRVLALAFSTYLVGFLSRVVLLAQWPLVEGLTRSPLVPPIHHLTTLGLVLAGIASAVLVIGALARILAIVDRLPRRIGTLGAIAALLAKPAVLGLLVLVWNARDGAAYAYCVVLALIPLQGAVVTILMAPMIVIDALLIRPLVRRLVVEPVHRTSEFLRDHEAGGGRRKLGNLAISELLARAGRHPPLEHRVLVELMPLTYLPLVLAFWS